MSKHIIVYIILICLLLSGCGNVAEIPVPTPETASAVSVQDTSHASEPETEPEVSAVPFLEEHVSDENVPVPAPSPEPTAADSGVPPVDAVSHSSDDGEVVAGPSDSGISGHSPAASPHGISDKAAWYLSHECYCARNDSEQISYFVKAMKSGVQTAGSITDDAQATAEGIESLVYLVPDGFHYIRLCAAVAGLTDTGTFADTENAHDEFLYLTGTNGFKSFPLGQCRCFGGDQVLKTGDVIFWFDDGGNAVSSGLVTGAASEYLKVIIQGWGETVAQLEINSSNLSSRCLEKGLAVSMEYPGVEYRIFAFLTEKMQYSVAAACGVMANMFKESGFIASTGKSTYGLCQWQGDRLTSFMNFCYENKLEVSALDSQLKFFRRELTEGDFQELNDLLLSLGNSEEEAFNSAKQFCIQYEKPGNAYAAGNDRGELAKKFYRLYAE